MGYRHSALWLFTFILFAFALPAFASSPLSVLATQWGFDGKCASGEFNQCAVLVSNSGDAPFEGIISLSERSFQGPAEKYVQEAYLAPHAKKWVIFSIFCDSNKAWTLRWGQTKDSEQGIGDSETGPPALVYINSAGALSSRVGLHAFPEMLFPSSVHLTAGLSGAALSETPNFSPSQAEAFMDWLHLGGQLFIVPGASGSYPAFSGRLAELNNPESRFRAGMGKVFKLKASLAELNPAFLAKAGYAQPDELKQKKNKSHGYNDLSGIVPAHLAKQVKPKHMWWLIYLLAVSYLTLVSVGNFVIARWRKSYWEPIAFFCVTTIVFAGLFAVIGARGYGESSMVNDMGYARSLGNGSFAVSQWENAFATYGGNYSISHKENLSYYTTGDKNGMFGSVISNGAGGFIGMTIPRFSSAGFIHCGQSSLPGFEAKLENAKMKMDANVSQLKFSLGGSFLKESKPLGIWAAWKNETAELDCKNGACHVKGGTSNLEALFNNWNEKAMRVRWSNMDLGDENNNASHALEILKEGVAPRLIMPALTGQPLFSWSESKEPGSNDGSYADLFVLAQTPRELQMESKDFKGSHGQTVFHFRFPVEMK